MTIPERTSEAEPRLNPQMAIELILGRQLISYLGVPMFLVDPRGDLLYYNEAAEAVLGIRFEETGRMLREEWSHVFSPTDADGNPWSEMYIHGLDDSTRHIEVIGIPIIGLAGKHLGGLAIFWEVE